MKTKKIRLPKMHSICDGDHYRPIFDHILITKDEAVAANNHALVVNRTSELFSNNFINSMPERMLVHKDQWKSFYSGSKFIDFKDGCICAIYDGYEIMHKVKLEDDKLRYPNYNAIFPSDSKKESVGIIGLNPELIKKISLAMILPSEVNRGFSFEFFGANNAVLIKSISDDYNSKCIIMPVVL